MIKLLFQLLGHIVLRQIVVTWFVWNWLAWKIWVFDSLRNWSLNPLKNVSWNMQALLWRCVLFKVTNWIVPMRIVWLQYPLVSSWVCCLDVVNLRFVRKFLWNQWLWNRTLGSIQNIRWLMKSDCLFCWKIWKLWIILWLFLKLILNFRT